MMAERSDWLTSKRLRAHGFLLALALWSLYIWTLATPGLRDRNGNFKGTDFLHLYTIGSLAIAHDGADLYSMGAQALVAAERVPEAAGIRYLPLYPPQVSIACAPLAHLSYRWALALWWALSAAIYGFSCYALWRACPHLQDYGGTVLLLAVAFPGFFNLIAWGQTSAIALACFTLLFFLLRARREFLAGLVLGCLIFKPQLGLAAAVVFVAIGAFGCGAIACGSRILRGRAAPKVDGDTVECPFTFAGARTETVSDALLANVLVDARSLARPVVRALRG
jgi:alpha-1,2-mannosyltransferase